jgi:peptidoglycan/LPS O-acetylase OafA/YrhL
MEFKRSAGIAGGGMASVVLTLACIPLILIVSEVNYRFVETRFRRIGRQIADDFSLKLTNKRVIERPQLAVE